MVADARSWSFFGDQRCNDERFITSMSILHAIVLGIVQGLTEFLPISSSGHLEIVPWLFKWNDYDSQATAKAFDTALHLGTLVAVFIYLRRELVVYLRSGLQIAFRRQSASPVIGKQAWFLVASAIPAGVVGVIFEDSITEKLGTPNLISISLIVFGLLLVWADRRATAAKSSHDVTISLHSHVTQDDMKTDT